MKVVLNRITRLQSLAAQFLLGIPGLAVITFVSLELGFGLQRAAFAYVILVALSSTLGSFSSSLLLSLLAVACLSYFFAPPRFDLRVDGADDVVKNRYVLHNVDYRYRADQQSQARKTRIR